MGKEVYCSHTDRSIVITPLPSLSPPPSWSGEGRWQSRDVLSISTPLVPLYLALPSPGKSSLIKKRYRSRFRPQAANSHSIDRCHICNLYLLCSQLYSLPWSSQPPQTYDSGAPVWYSAKRQGSSICLQQHTVEDHFLVKTYPFACFLSIVNVFGPIWTFIPKSKSFFTCCIFLNRPDWPCMATQQIAECRW